MKNGMKKRKIVIALGHEALGTTLPEQKEATKRTAKAVADLISEDAQVIITHSNGPQVGMIHTATLEYEKTANIVLIPMLSGYRDGKNMQLCIEHNYSKWYAEHDITLDSEPKSAMDFRKVIMLDQIESISLFDPASASALAMRE